MDVQPSPIPEMGAQRRATVKIGYGKISIGYGWIRGMNSATRGHNAIKAGWDSKIRNAGHIGCGR